VSRAVLLALSLALAACGVRGPPRPPHAAEGPADAGAPADGRPLGKHCLAPECDSAAPAGPPCAEADGGCAP
jgi:predicted small lipoprotein YifL